MTVALRKGKMTCDDTGRDGSDAATSQRLPRTSGSQQKLRRGQESFLLRAFRGSIALVTLGF